MREGQAYAVFGFAAVFAAIAFFLAIRERGHQEGTLLIRPAAVTYWAREPFVTGGVVFLVSVVGGSVVAIAANTVKQER